MARNLSAHGRLLFADAIRSIFSVTITFTPFEEVGAHLLGFGIRILYHRGEQASVTVYVPFYHVYCCRLSMRYSAEAQAALEKATPPIVEVYSVVKGCYVPSAILTAYWAAKADKEALAAVAAEINEREGYIDRFAIREGLESGPNGEDAK